MRKTSAFAGPILGLSLFTAACAVLMAVHSPSLNVNAEPALGTRDFPIRNDIDKHILIALREMKVEPSAACSDEEFVRRVYLDVCGLIPPRADTKAFLADKSADKRAKLIDRVLGSDRYADHWTVMWCDLLREHTNSRNQEGTERGSYRGWIKESLAKNVPYDQFVRALLTSKGSAEDNAAVNFFLRDERNRVETVNTVSNAFMGTRMECAQCHDHPFDKWTQYDFHNVMAFFGRTLVAPDPIESILRLEKNKQLPAEARKLLEPHVKEAREANEAENKKLKLGGELAMAGNAGGGGMGGMDMAMGDMAMAMKGMGKGRDVMKEIEKALPTADGVRFRQLVGNSRVNQVLEQVVGEYKMPADGDSQDRRKKTGEVVQPVFPWDPSKKAAPTDFRRKALADFVVGHRQFAEVQVNRLWAQLMGKGIVDPVDDFRPKNPPSHPELLAYLADEFVKAKFDNKHVLRLILNSSTYQRSSLPNASNRSDTSLFSHQRLRRLTAEQLFDSIQVASGREKGLEGTRVADAVGGMMKNMGVEKAQTVQWAADLPTPARTGSFMNEFNQPNREQTIAKREVSGSITQALELLNGTTVSSALRGSLLIKSLVDSKATARDVVTESYLGILSRMPTAEEMRFSVAILKDPVPAREAIEDLHWGLLNAREFAFNR